MSSQSTTIDASKLQYEKERLRERSILGAGVTERAGLGFFPTIQVDKVKGKEKRRFIHGEVRRREDEKRLARIVELKQ